MRILVAHEAADSAGGVESYLGAVIPELRRRGHAVAALHHRRRSSRTGGAWCDAAEWTVGIEESGLADGVRRASEWKPDACFSNNMGPLDFEAELLQRWPVVKMMHGYFGTCVSGLKTRRYPSAQPCARRFGPTCLALYGPCRCGRLSLTQMIRGYSWAERQRSLFAKYAAVGVPSGHMRAEYERNGVPASQLEVLPLFATVAPSQRVATASIDVRCLERASEATRVEGACPERAHGCTRVEGQVVFVGRMTTLKGGDVLVRAAADAAQLIGRGLPLTMIGDGPQRAEWMQLARALGVDATFSGWLSPPDRDAVLSQAALLVVPSVWPEPFGLVGLEAASFGVPAVAFDSGGVRDWLRHGASGLLVNPEHGPRGLADAIAKLWRDPECRSRMGERAIAVAREMSVAAHVDRLEAVLARAAAGTPS
jgi:glycosyltransferase involved in cell wall biosynthesis